MVLISLKIVPNCLVGLLSAYSISSSMKKFEIYFLRLTNQNSFYILFLYTCIGNITYFYLMYRQCRFVSTGRCKQLDTLFEIYMYIFHLLIEYQILKLQYKSIDALLIINGLKIYAFEHLHNIDCFI